MAMECRKDHLAVLWARWELCVFLCFFWLRYNLRELLIHTQMLNYNKLTEERDTVEKKRGYRFSDCSCGDLV